MIEYIADKEHYTKVLAIRVLIKNKGENHE
jgi:hypothetical protein